MSRKKAHTPVPEGYELLPRNTRLKHGDLFLDFVDYPDGPWHETVVSGRTVWNPGIIYCRKIPAASKAPKPTGKATWTAKGLPEMSIRTTKRQIREHLELAIMALNDLGTENAKLKNAIARMKRSAR